MVLSVADAAFADAAVAMQQQLSGLGLPGFVLLAIGDAIDGDVET